MKTCTGCQLSKPKDQFNKRSLSKDGLQTWCRQCTREHHQAVYPEKCKAYRKRNKQNRLDYCDWLDSLITGPCADCGLDLSKQHPRVGQWDHLPGQKKEFNIGDTRKSCIGRERLLRELDKCHLVCANCHASRSALRQTPEKLYKWLSNLPSGSEVAQERCRGLDISDLDLVVIPSYRGTGLWREPSSIKR